MKSLRAFLSRIVPSRKRDEEFRDELECHLQMHADDNLRAGMTPEQARRDAIIKLGGVEPTREAYRDRSTIPALDHMQQDVHFAMRQLRKNPAFTGTAILMLALGMCASVAIFAFVDAALIKPLPYQNPSRLVGVFESAAMFKQSNLSYPDYLDWKKLSTSFTALESYQGMGLLMNTSSGAELVRGARVSDGFLRVLGVNPVLGRDFYAGEDLPGVSRTVLLSYSAWQKRYGGNRNAVGQVVTLNGEPNVIVGVLPREFHFAPAGPAEFWTGIHAAGQCDLRRSCHVMYGVIAYPVGQRTREIGIRMALGAEPGLVYKLILKEAGRLTGAGIAVGIACSIAAATLISGLLFDVRTWDVPTLAGVAVVLGAAALLASFIPARRAASVNPVIALRAE